MWRLCHRLLRGLEARGQEARGAWASEEPQTWGWGVALRGQIPAEPRGVEDKESGASGHETAPWGGRGKNGSGATVGGGKQLEWVCE